MPLISEATGAVYQYSVLTADEQSEMVRQVIRSGALGAAGGTGVALVERRVAAMVGRREAVAVSSATAGLELLLRASGIGPGDEVVVPELSWVSVGASVWAVGAQPVVAPVDASLAPSWDDIDPLIGSRTKAVVVAHMRGMAAADARRVALRLREAGVALIEDCAEAWGVRSVGRNGLASVFSTQTYKLIATGEGGFVVTDSEALLQALRALSGDTRIATTAPAWRLNYRMGEVQAAMALPQLDSIGDLVLRLVSLQREMVPILARSPAVRAVMPIPDRPDDDTNGSLVGLWFYDPGLAIAAVDVLGRSGFRCYQPGAQGDLHVASSWPVVGRQSLVDLRSYADVAVPVLDLRDRESFLAQLREIAQRLPR